MARRLPGAVLVRATSGPITPIAVLILAIHAHTSTNTASRVNRCNNFKRNANATVWIPVTAPGSVLGLGICAQGRGPLGEQTTTS
jgi:hypothetical protein